MVVGSDYVFDSRGAHELKGVPGRWPVWAVVDRLEADHREATAQRTVTVTDRAVPFLARRAPSVLRRLAAALEPKT